MAFARPDVNSTSRPAGAIDTHEHTPTLTERRIDAMMLLLRQKPGRSWTTDEMRRTIESLTPGIYEGSGYYARWTLAKIISGKTNQQIRAELAEDLLQQAALEDAVRLRRKVVALVGPLHTLALGLAPEIILDSSAPPSSPARTKFQFLFRK